MINGKEFLQRAEVSSSQMMSSFLAKAIRVPLSPDANLGSDYFPLWEFKFPLMQMPYAAGTLNTHRHKEAFTAILKRNNSRIRYY